jgi:superfamily II DNA or RNA helicase
MHIKIDPYFRVDVYSHFFIVSKITQSTVVGLLLKFSSKYVHNSLPGQKVTPANAAEPKLYAVKTRDDKEFRFHMGQYEHFKRFIADNYVLPEFFTEVIHPHFEPQKIKMKLKDTFKLYDYQQEAEDFIVDSDVSDFNTRLVTMPTGTGKGVTSLSTTARLGNKFLVVVLAKYTEKWAIEVAQKTDVQPKEIMIIQGSGQLRGILHAAKENKKAVAKCTIFSLTTIQNFFKLYEENPDSEEVKGYGCTPQELCEILGVGTVIIDETHEHLHAVFKFLCYTHVPKVIALSGTVISLDPFIENMHKVMFPLEIRFDKIKMKKYIRAYAIGYSFRDIRQAKIRTTEFGSNNYSQTAFEKSVLKNPETTKNFMKLISMLMDIGYMKNYQKGDKLAIYAGSILMCGAIVEYLKTKYPHLDIRRYVEDDPYENVIEADIRVTTIISAGTAIDIPQLTCVIMTNSVKSPVANLQTLGRLRDLPGRDPNFIYIYSDDIPKQINYHRDKMELFADRVASMKVFKSPILL